MKSIAAKWHLIAIVSVVCLIFLIEGIVQNNEKDFFDFYSDAGNRVKATDQLEIMSDEDRENICNSVGQEDYKNVKKIKAIHLENYYIIFGNGQIEDPLKVKVLKCVVYYNNFVFEGEGVPRTPSEFFIALGGNKDSVFKLVTTQWLMNLREGAENIGAARVSSQKKISSKGTKVPAA